MALTKPAGTWRYSDLFTLPDDGTRYEIIDGELYEMPAPTWAHASVIAGLITLLIPVLQRLGAQLEDRPARCFLLRGRSRATRPHRASARQSRPWGAAWR